MLDKLKQLKEQAMNNRTVVESGKKIFREDGTDAEQIVYEIFKDKWTKNNASDIKAPDFKVPTMGIVDLKTGLAKKYNGNFVLEVIQNPNTGLKSGNILDSVSSWTIGGTDFLCYLDLSDETFPLYFFDVVVLSKMFKVTEILHALTTTHLKHYAEYWKDKNTLMVPRKVEGVPPLLCFGHNALGYKIPISIASQVIYLDQYIKEQDARNTNSTGTNRTYKKKTNPMLYPAKALYDSSIGK